MFIVDADDDARDRDVMHLTLTILTGAHKSEVITLTARAMPRDSADLLGLPGTLYVENGEPRLELDA